MGLFLIVFCFLIFIGHVVADNSRFATFNSRLGLQKFPFTLLREFGRKILIFLWVFGSGTALFENNRKNSRYHGNCGNLPDRLNGVSDGC
jgi:hypothetical protein